VVTVRSKYLDGVGVVGVGGFWLQGADELTEVVVDVITVGYACNVELYDVKL
jgi:hypothetical protein